MELTTSWEEKGRQEGLKEGQQRGEATVVLRLLKRRFGQLVPNLEAQVSGLPSPQLESLAEALLDFSSIDDLKRWLQHN